jgi:hypothetical protein
MKSSGRAHLQLYFLLVLAEPTPLNLPDKKVEMIIDIKAS